MPWPIPIFLQARLIGLFGPTPLPVGILTSMVLVPAFPSITPNQVLAAGRRAFPLLNYLARLACSQCKTSLKFDIIVMALGGLCSYCLATRHALSAWVRSMAQCRSGSSCISWVDPPFPVLSPDRHLLVSDSPVCCLYVLAGNLLLDWRRLYPFFRAVTTHV